MALIIIKVQPTNTEANVTVTPTLERRRWTFRFYKNSVLDAWFWDLINDSQETVIDGEGLSLAVDLFSKFRGLDIPPGFLFVVEQGEGTGGRDPTQNDFEEGLAILYYLESE